MAQALTADSCLLGGLSHPTCLPPSLSPLTKEGGAVVLAQVTKGQRRVVAVGATSAVRIIGAGALPAEDLRGTGCSSRHASFATWPIFPRLRGYRGIDPRPAFLSKLHHTARRLAAPRRQGWLGSPRTCGLLAPGPLLGVPATALPLPTRSSVSNCSQQVIPLCPCPSHRRVFLLSLPAWWAPGAEGAVLLWGICDKQVACAGGCEVAFNAQGMRFSVLLVLSMALETSLCPRVNCICRSATFNSSKPALSDPLTVVIVDAEKVGICGWVGGQEKLKGANVCCNACARGHAAPHTAQLFASGDCLGPSP